MIVNNFKTKYNIHKGGYNVLFGYKRFGLFQCWTTYPNNFTKLGDAVDYGLRYTGKRLPLPVKSNFHIIMELLIVSMILAFFIYGITSC